MPAWLLRCAEDEALEREEQRKISAEKKKKEHSSTGRENARSDPWLDAENKAADRGISDDRQRPFYFTSSTTLSRGGRDAKRFRSKATAAMLAREKRRIQEEAYVRAVKSGWLQVMMMMMMIIEKRALIHFFISFSLSFAVCFASLLLPH
jgi:hypothetical protein